MLPRVIASSCEGFKPGLLRPVLVEGREKQSHCLGLRIGDWCGMVRPTKSGFGDWTVETRYCHVMALWHER